MCVAGETYSCPAASLLALPRHQKAPQSTAGCGGGELRSISDGSEPPLVTDIPHTWVASPSTPMIQSPGSVTSIVFVALFSIRYPLTLQSSQSSGVRGRISGSGLRAQGSKEGLCRERRAGGTFGAYDVVVTKNQHPAETALCIPWLGARKKGTGERRPPALKPTQQYLPQQK